MLGLLAASASLGNVRRLQLVPSAAAAIPAIRPRRFEADYADMLHPLCERHIRIEGKTPSGEFVARISGTDVGPPGIGPTVKIACDEENIRCSPRHSHR